MTTNSDGSNDAALTTDQAVDVAVDFWVSKISKALGYSAGWLVQTGQHLIEAKQALGHGGWLRLFVPGKLRFGVRTAEMLMRIARHPCLRSSQYLAHLPPSSTTLYELARADEQTIRQGIADGRINPRMSLRQARALARSSGSHEFSASTATTSFDPAKRTAKLTRHVLDEAQTWPTETRAQLADALVALAEQIRTG